jgi:hypothetical protein
MKYTNFIKIVVSENNRRQCFSATSHIYRVYQSAWANLKNDFLTQGQSKILYLCISSKKNEIVGACSSYGGEESCIQDFGGET